MFHFRTLLDCYISVLISSFCVDSSLFFSTSFFTIFLIRSKVIIHKIHYLNVSLSYHCYQNIKITVIVLLILTPFYIAFGKWFSGCLSLFLGVMCSNFFRNIKVYNSLISSRERNWPFNHWYFKNSFRVNRKNIFVNLNQESKTRVSLTVSWTKLA